MEESNATLVIEEKESKVIQYSKNITYPSIIVWIIIDLLFKFNII